MPWDGTALTMAELAWDDRGLPVGALPGHCRRRGHGHRRAGTFRRRPHLAYMSMADGWDNLALDLSGDAHRPLVNCDVDLGTPAWVQGVRTHAWAPDSATVYYGRNEGGVRRLWQVQVASGQTAPLAGLDEYTDFDQPAVSSAGHLAVIASGPCVPPRLLVLPESEERRRVVARADGEIVPPETFVEPRP
jgi:hypothetical protein